MRAKFSAILLSITAAAIACALGYALVGTAWPQDSTVTMQLSLGNNSGTLIDGSPSFGVVAENALAIWNNYLVHLRFAVVRDSTVNPSSGDSLNSVFFSSNVFGQSFGNDTVAITLRRFSGSRTIEADVVFNNAKPWNSYRGPLRQAASGGTLQDFRRVALHEFGHVLGLDHPDQANQNVTAIMNSLISDIDNVQSDDIAGAQYLYGGPAPTVTPTPPPNAGDKLINLSTRGFVGTGDNVMIGGFIVQGVQPTTAILRAIGPSLTAFGVPTALSDPVLELRDANGNLLQRNDDWQNDPNAQTVRSRNLAPNNSLESALVATMSAGRYTAIVSGYGSATGNALVELYDLQATAARAGNISTRGFVQTGDRVMIGGFIIGGDRTKEVIIRGIGPSLRAFGLTNVLADPVIELRNSAGNLISSNDDWPSSPDAAAITAHGLAPNDRLESALLATLIPGNYTVITRGYSNATGIGLVEVYDLSPAPNQ